MSPYVYYYHRVGPFRKGAPLKMNVDPVHFRQHMEVLAKRGNPTSLDTLIDCAIAGKATPKGAVAVTFDDGYRDLIEHALPTLKRLKIPATFFIVTEGVGKTDAWNEATDVPREPILSWDEIKKLRDAGMTIGSHSARHEVMDGLSAAKLKAELVDSKATLESKLGIQVRHFAYPQGRFSDAAQSAVREAGYDSAWATRKGRALSNENRYAIGRVPVSSYIKGGRFRWELFLRRIGLKKN